MRKDLGNYRKSYEKDALSKNRVPDSPLELFAIWFKEAEADGGEEEPNAMTVATVGLDGYPKTRIVLLKEFSNDGFVFYTNYQSEKGMAIKSNPRVCLSFFWPAMERQVIIKGTAERVSSGKSDTYFDSRPQDSKFGAVISDQSSVIASREVLDTALNELKDRMKTGAIRRPDHWGGYCVSPVSVEFWQGRQNRLHDRIRYVVDKHLKWTKERLAP